jgi:4-deoxy-L-threo-5-hexosulose-uronate ketol-isomerase
VTVPAGTVPAGTVRTLYSTHPDDYSSLPQAELAARFVLPGPAPGQRAAFAQTHDDRMLTGHLRPAGEQIPLAGPASPGRGLLDGREAALVCVDGQGEVNAGDQRFTLGPRDIAYIGLGESPVCVGGADVLFFLVSTPAHRCYRSRLIRADEVAAEALGRRSHAKQRVTRKYLHSRGMPACQLTLGITDLLDGNVWHTMPCHLHDNRTELYMYFGLPADERVLHLMGKPGEVRTLFVRNLESVICPPWSVHAGAGTVSYSFVWAMSGTNRDFDDIDRLPLSSLG